MGAPRKDKLRKPIQVRLSEHEREILDIATEKEGGTVAGLLRRGGLKEAREIIGENGQ
jgi:hypothetical protein